MEMASSKKAAKQRSLLRKAIKDCDAAVKIDPSWVRAYQRKAESLLELEQVEESISAAEQGLHVSDGTCPHCSKLVSKVRLQQMKASNKSENDIWAQDRDQDRDELMESQFQQRFEQVITDALRNPRTTPLNRKEQAEMTDSEEVQELVMQALDLESTALEKAMALYEQAAQRSSTIAMLALSRICLTNENPGLCALNHSKLIGRCSRWLRSNSICVLGTKMHRDRAFARSSNHGGERHCCRILLWAAGSSLSTWYWHHQRLKSG